MGKRGMRVALLALALAAALAMVTGHPVVGLSSIEDGLPMVGDSDAVPKHSGQKQWAEAVKNAKMPAGTVASKPKDSNWAAAVKQMSNNKMKKVVDSHMHAKKQPSLPQHKPLAENQPEGALKPQAKKQTVAMKLKQANKDQMKQQLKHDEKTNEKQEAKLEADHFVDQEDKAVEALHVKQASLKEEAAASSARKDYSQEIKDKDNAMDAQMKIGLP